MTPLDPQPAPGEPQAPGPAAPSPLGLQVQVEGKWLDALPPEQVVPQHYDLVCLAMQEPQYSASGVRELMRAIAAARVPCMSMFDIQSVKFSVNA